MPQYKWLLAIPIAVLFLIAPKTLSSAAVEFMVVKRVNSLMQVTYENVSYGYEGDPNDGCLGTDEQLEWVAEGNLEAGELFTYTYLVNCQGARHISGRAFVLQGHSAQLLVEIYTNLNGSIQTASGLGEASLERYESMGPMEWRVMVTNVGDRIARRIYFNGSNRDAGY